MLNSKGIRIVEARTRNQIRKIAYRFRKDLGLDKEEYFPIMRVLECVLPVVYPGFMLEPVEDKELKGRMAETLPEQNVIRVKNSVYEAACQGNWFARMVMAHELGHYFLHDPQNTSYAYLQKGEALPADVDPERQADIFAAELLIPIHLIGNKNVYQVSKHFGVSRKAAGHQMNQALKVEKRHRRKNRVKEKRSNQH